MRRINRLSVFSRKWILCLGLQCLLFSQQLNHAVAQEGSPNQSPRQPVAGQSDSSGLFERIYIPFQKFDQTFEADEANILLNLEKYEKLLETWRQVQASSQSTQIAISKADYVANVEGNIARIKAVYTIQVFGKKWAELPLDFGSLTIGHIQAPDRVLMRASGNGKYVLVFPENGTHTVELDLAAAVSASSHGQVLSFRVPVVPVTTLDLTVPEADLTFEHDANIVPISTQNTEAQSRLQANLASNSEVRVRWVSQADSQSDQEALAAVTHLTAISVQGDLVHTDRWVRYDVLRGKLGQARFSLPADQRVLDVQIPGHLKGWSVQQDNGQQILTAELLTSTEKSFTVEIHTEQKLQENSLNAGGKSVGTEPQGFHVLDVTRESGQIAVRSSSDLMLTIADQTGVSRINSNDLDSKLPKENSLAFRYYSPVYALRLNVQPVEPRLTALHHARFIFGVDELRIVSNLNYTAERTGVFELNYELPQGVVVDNVTCPGMKNFQVADQKLTITLNEALSGAFQVTINAHQTIDSSNQSSFPLPILKPVSVERETGTVEVFARESVEVQTDHSTLQSAQPLAINPSQQSGPDVLTAAWSFHRRPVVIPVKILRKPTRLTAKTGTTIQVQPDLTRVVSRINYVVEFAGTNTFRIQVPEAVSGQLRIETDAQHPASVSIQQRTASEPAEGHVIWTVQTQREVLGEQRFIVTYEFPHQNSSSGSAADSAEESHSIELLKPLGLTHSSGETATPLTRIQGEVSIERDIAVSVTAEGVGTDLERIDPRQLTFLSQQGIQAYRYTASAESPPLSLTVSSKRFETQEVVSTVVSRALVEIVTSEDVAATYRCRLLLRTSERQRLLVYLPINLEVLGTFLNDKEVRLEKSQEPVPEGLEEQLTPFWVNVARAESSETPLLLTFHFLWKINPTLGESQFSRGQMELPLPSFGGHGNQTLQQLKVVVWTPEKYSLVGSPQSFHLNTQSGCCGLTCVKPADIDVAGLENWLHEGIATRPSNTISLPTEARVPYVYSNLGGASLIALTWWNRFPMTLILSGTVAIIGFLLLGTSWQNKLTIVLLIAFLATLYGLKDSHALASLLSGARYGIFFTFALWIVAELFSFFRNGQTPSLATTNQTAPPVENASASDPVPPTDEKTS